MMDAQEKPRLRPLLMMITESEGRRFIVAQDQTGQSSPVILPAQLEPLLRLMDGNHTMRDIQAELTRAGGGQIVPMDEIVRIVRELDSHLMLDSQRFRETVELEKRFWKQGRLRRPFHAGTAYPPEPVELAEMLNGFYCGLERPPGGDAHFVRGLLAPHIDIKNGGETFARAFNYLRTQPQAQLFIILGTAHSPTPELISISRKDYVTPLGIMETDIEFIDRLTDKFPSPYITDDAAHRAEHSIEFQTVFLEHILGRDSESKIVPILVGSFSEFVETRTRPSEDGYIKNFLDALGKTIEEDGRKITCIVGGDLAHIGPRYGDPDPVLPSDIEACGARDMEMLEATAGGADDFFDYVAAEGDRRNICGMPPLYIMLKLIEGASGSVVHHAHWFDQSTRSAVTFAAMVFN